MLTAVPEVEAECAEIADQQVCVYVHLTPSLTGPQAGQACQQTGARLIHIDSQDVHTLVLAAMARAFPTKTNAWFTALIGMKVSAGMFYFVYLL